MAALDGGDMSAVGENEPARGAIANGGLGLVSRRFASAR